MSIPGEIRIPSVSTAVSPSVLPAQSTIAELPWQMLGKSLVPVLFVNPHMDSGSQLFLFLLDRYKQRGSG